MVNTELRLDKVPVLRIQNPPNSFRSSGAVFEKISGAERWSGLHENGWSGAERWSGIFENFLFFCLFSSVFSENSLKNEKKKRSLLAPAALACV